MSETLVYLPRQHSKGYAEWCGPSRETPYRRQASGLLAALAMMVLPSGAAMSAAGVNLGGLSTFQIDNAVTGPGRYEVVVAPGGGTTFAPVFPLDTSATAFDLVSEFTPFVQLGPTGGARELSLFGDNTVEFIAQTGTVRSVGAFTGPNGAINWVSESRLPAGSLRFENTVTFSSASPFGAVRFISFLDASTLDRAVALAPTSSPNFSMLNFSSDPARPTGISHGIARSQLVGATYSGWVMREANTVYGNIVDPEREVFSIPGVIDSLTITTPDPRFAFSTVYRIFQSNNEPATAFAVDLNPTANQATIVTYLVGWPQLLNDGLYRNGFEN